MDASSPIAVLNAYPALDGQIAAVVVNDEATLKRIFHTREGLCLHAENPRFPDRLIPRAQLESVRIPGVFVGLVRGR